MSSALHVSWDPKYPVALVALVSSINRDCSRYTTVVRSKQPREEVAPQLAEMVHVSFSERVVPEQGLTKRLNLERANAPDWPGRRGWRPPETPVFSASQRVNSTGVLAFTKVPSLGVQSRTDNVKS